MVCYIYILYILYSGEWGRFECGENLNFVNETYNNCTILMKKINLVDFTIYHICFVYQLFNIIILVAQKKFFAYLGNIFFHIESITK